MKKAFLLIVGLVVAGCATASRNGPSGSAHDRSSDTPGLSRDLASSGARASRDLQDEVGKSAASSLPYYEVRESAISDFGMSVKTNFEVKWGGNVEWMVVTHVGAGSSAAHAGIRAGDRILAIDGRLVTDIDRDTMIEVLFQRKKGEIARLLILERTAALPHFVAVAAGRPPS